jgi:hypothetical protein
MSICDEILAEFHEELTATRRILDRIPADKLAWKPHEKSMSLGQLAMHIATVPGGIVFITHNDSFDVLKGNFAPPHPADTAESILLSKRAYVRLKKHSKKETMEPRGRHGT